MPYYQYANYIRRIYSFIDSNVDLISSDFNSDTFLESLNTLDIKEKEKRLADILNFVADIGLLVQNVIKDSEIHEKVFSSEDFDEIKKKGVIDIYQIKSILTAILPVSSKIDKDSDYFVNGDLAWQFKCLAEKIIKLVDSKVVNIYVPGILTSIDKQGPYLEGRCESNLMNFCGGLTLKLDFVEKKLTAIPMPVYIINSLENILAARAHNMQFQRPSSSKRNEEFLKALLNRLQGCYENIQFMKEFDIDFNDYNEKINQLIVSIELVLSTLVSIVLNKKSLPLKPEKITSHSLFKYIPKTMQDSTTARKNNPQTIQKIYDLIEEIKPLIVTPVLEMQQ